VTTADPWAELHVTRPGEGLPAELTPPALTAVPGDSDSLTDAEYVELLAAGQPHAVAPPEHVDELYPTVDWHQLWTKAGSPVDWLCEPLLLAGRAVAMFSPAKAGKSLLALEISAALATGRPVLGNPAREPLDVLYVDLENTEDDLRERLTDLGYDPTSDLSRLHYLSFPNLPALDSPKGGRHLHSVAQRHHAQLVVIDTVSRVVDGEENDADTFRELYRHAIRPLKAAGIASWRLDHSGKHLDRGQRGSSAKVDDVDSVWQLIARNSGTLDLKRTHSRNRHGNDRLTLTRLSNPLRHMPAHLDSVIAADVQEVIDLLDHLEIPVEWGRDKVRSALLEAGERRGNDVLAEAIRHRKRLADLSADRSSPDDALWPDDEPPDSDEEPA
jgi:hypothetical protein